MPSQWGLGLQFLDFGGCKHRSLLVIKIIFIKTVLVYTVFFFCLFVCFVLFPILWPQPWHMELPRLGVQSELQLLSYATATATWNLSHFCDLQHSSRKRRILNPLSKARDRTCLLMDTSQIINPLSRNGNSST